MTSLEWGLFLVAWIVAGGSPGPATMAIAGTAMQRGRSFSIAMSLGILFGSACWGLAAALGISALMVSNAWMFEVLRYAGATYLLWLAFKALRSAASADGKLIAKSADGDTRRVFLKGALIHLTNPKAILSWGAVYTLVLTPDAGVRDTLGVFLFLYSGSIFTFVGYAFLFSSAPLVAAYRKARRWFELVFAGFFGAASLRILTARFVTE